MVEATKSNLSRIKDLRGAVTLEKSKYYKELLTQKEDTYSNCFLIDTLAQISSLNIQFQPEGSAEMKFGEKFNKLAES